MHGWDSQWLELKEVRIFNAQTIQSLNIVFLAFRLGACGKCRTGLSVNRAARRLGHPASIPRAIMSRSPGALALGPPARFWSLRRGPSPSAPPSFHSGVAITALRSGAFLTGLATALGPGSRRYRVGAMLTLLRVPLSAACASLRRFSALPRDGFVGCAGARVAGRHRFGASILSKRQRRECAVRFPVPAIESESEGW